MLRVSNGNVCEGLYADPLKVVGSKEGRNVKPSFKASWDSCMRDRMSKRNDRSDGEHLFGSIESILPSDRAFER